MKSFSNIFEPAPHQEHDMSEFVGFLIASSIIGYMTYPMLKDTGKAFWEFFKNKKDKDKKGKEKDDDDDDDDKKGKDKDKEKDNKAFNELLFLAKKSNQKEKDENTKKKNDATLKLLTACSFDKDGNELPLEERVNKMKDSMTSEQFEAYKKEAAEVYEKNKDSQEFKDALAKAKANIKPEDYDKMLEDAKKEAKATMEQLDKEKKEIEEHKQKLDELEKQIKGETDETKLEELKKQQTELQQNAPVSMIAAATGVTTTGAPALPSGQPEPQEPTNKDDDKDDEKTKKEKSDDEIKAEHDKIDKEYKEKSAALEKEYQEKIDKETDKDKKEALENEWLKKESELSAEKNKKKDELDDSDEHDTEKDETKNGKYKVQDEEVTDPKTGEKIKVKTYTGPRGGKFYYPEGSPKTPENKVYVESISLKNYLLESLYQ